MRLPQFLRDLQREGNRSQYINAVTSTAIIFAGLFLLVLIMYSWNIFTSFQFIVLTGFVFVKIPALLYLRKNIMRWEGVVFPLFFNIFLNLTGFTIIVYFTGPFTSHFFALYLIHVMVVALYYNLESALVVSALTTLCYGSMKWLVYLRLIPFPSPFLGEDILERIHPRYIVGVTVLLFALMCVVSVLAFYINRRLRESEREARKLSRVKEEFFTRVTHEFRVPLHGILGLLTLLKEGVYGSVAPQQRGALDMMGKSSQSLLELVNDLLDLSKLSSGKMDVLMERVSIFDVLNNVSSIAVPLAREKGLSFVTDVPEGLPALATDRVKLHQILTNLVGNAIKFTEIGSVTIRTRASETTVSISVEDTGIGIENKNLPQLFDEFSQVGRTSDTKKKGSGLGLSISKRLAELLGGQISVQSTPGRGSVFTLTLPLSPFHREV